MKEWQEFCNQAKKSAGYIEWNAGSVFENGQKLASRILTILLYRKIIRESVLVLRTYYNLSPPDAR